MLQLHLHLSLSLCLNGFLDSLSDTFFRDLELELHVLFVSDALLSQNILDLRVAHISLILEILDTRGLNGDINLDKTRLLASFHGLLLRLFGQMGVIAASYLFVLHPAVGKDTVVKLVNFIVELVSLLLELPISLILFRLGKLGLSKGAIRDSILRLEPTESFSEGLLPCIVLRLSMLLIILLTLQTKIIK